MSLAALPSIDVIGRLSRRPAAGQPRISRADKTLLARSAHGEGRLGPPKSAVPCDPLGTRTAFTALPALTAIDGSTARRPAAAAEYSDHMP